MYIMWILFRLLRRHHYGPTCEPHGLLWTPKCHVYHSWMGTVSPTSSPKYVPEAFGALMNIQRSFPGCPWIPHWPRL